MVVGDAAGTVNPFNGEGIAYAYETGAWRPTLLDEALHTGDGLALQHYAARCSTTSTASTSRWRALFVHVIGRPARHARAHARRACSSRTLMEWVLRIMANLLRPDELGPAEAAYKAVAAIVRLYPDR